ncbi:LpqB family beta-propeller domain-containing protein [Dactylosporangium sp. CA-233914]|uniref:LpqB family beta-propeller domain-containing protein n=1 Tax=Dactylosporangium sp. CA-233914 TaxID=3239934 RepID=UPI003D8AEDDD
MLVVVAALLALAALNGCGLPSRTEPKFAGPPQSPAAAQGVVKSPPVPSDDSTASGLLDLFLQSGVGANLGGDGSESDAGKETLDRMRQFMTDQMAARWKPSGGGLVIVRDDPDKHENQVGGGRVTIPTRLEPIGVIDERGQVTPAQPDDEAITFTYEVATVSGKPRLDVVPQDKLYISETGFKNWYVQQPIYFWATGSDASKLVPDLRYMPSTLSRTKQVSEILRWLNRGPASWLQSGQGGQGVAASWPETFDFKDNPVIENDDVKINLGGKAAGKSAAELNRLARQIRWSLPDHKPVLLSIETQPYNTTTDGFEDDNAAVEASEVSQERYAVAGGEVRTVNIPSSGELPLFAPSDTNKAVVSAALNRSATKAALVRQESKNEQRLYVSSPDLPVANPPKYVRTDVAGARLSRPAFITYPARRLMISDGARLLVSTDESGRTFEPVAVSSTMSPITAFAVAPEGRRIAFVAGKALMVAPLQLDNGTGKFSIGAPQEITTTLGSNQAVAWLTETALAVGGKPSPVPAHGEPAYSLVAITIDGAEERPLPLAPKAASQFEVSALVAHMNNPLESIDYPIMFESNGVARQLYFNATEPLQPKSAAAPQPSSGVELPTAPFFAD